MPAVPQDDLYKPLSTDFLVPTNRDIGAIALHDGDGQCAYLCGNSLGLLSKTSLVEIQTELNIWGTRANQAHFSHPNNLPWVAISGSVHGLLAELIGAHESEVACMSTLTNNLHLMMHTFYKPTPNRCKILCEAKAFPSDQYAFESQVSLHGYDPSTTILKVSSRPGEYALREEDIIDVIEREGDTIALVLFSGVQYFTGQLFPMETITQKAHEKGCICGWDLAHAIGNVPLSLHDWKVDFAVWCTYKYVNSGPGGIAGLFVHESWHDSEKPKFAGWWGHDSTTRFEMPATFSPIRGAQGFQQSNPCVLSVASLRGSLKVFKSAGMMQPIRERSIKLTGEFERLLKSSQFFVPLEQIAQGEKNMTKPGFSIITPSDPGQRGAQLSLLCLPIGSDTMSRVLKYLSHRGVIGDEREPDVIRLSPAPLYNTLADCERAVRDLDNALGLLKILGGLSTIGP